jgi:hypothetical protein
MGILERMREPRELATTPSLPGNVFEVREWLDDFGVSSTSWRNCELFMVVAALTG